MNNRKEMKTRLLNTLKALERKLQYRGLKDYVRNLQRKGYRNGKEASILKGATAYLNRLQDDMRSKSLGLVEYVPYDERDRYEDVTMQCDFRSWERSLNVML